MKATRTRTVISKSAKKKINSFVEFPDENNRIVKIFRFKAGTLTEQVVY